MAHAGCLFSFKDDVVPLPGALEMILGSLWSPACNSVDERKRLSSAWNWLGWGPAPV